MQHVKLDFIYLSKVTSSSTGLSSGWCKKNPKLCVTMMAHILYREKFLFADL